jgi:putative phosphonate transport system ATP-binding protein
VLTLADISPTPAEAPLLNVTGLGKSFGARVACRDVSFDLWPGEVLGVVGESGSGKTTLLNCLSARLQPDAGRVEYRMRDGNVAEAFELSEPARRVLRTRATGCASASPPAPISASG